MPRLLAAALFVVALPAGALLILLVSEAWFFFSAPPRPPLSWTRYLDDGSRPQCLLKPEVFFKDQVFRGGQLAFERSYRIGEYCRRETPLSGRVKRGRFLLVLGDSLVFGWGVEDNETLPFFLGLEQKALMPYNFGNIGYGPQSFMRQLEHPRYLDGVSEAAGEALLVLTLGKLGHLDRLLGSVNIPYFWGGGLPYYRQNSDGKWENAGLMRERTGFKDRLVSWLSRFHLFGYIDVVSPFLGEHDYKLLASAVKEIGRRLEQQRPGTRLTAVIHPFTPSGPANAAVAAFRAENVAFLDYSALLAGRDLAVYRFLGGPAESIVDHPTPELNRLLAARIARDLEAR